MIYKSNRQHERAMHPLKLGGKTTVSDKESLYAALGTMTDEEFSERVDGQRNDFASWVEHELGDKFLAASMRRAKDREEMRKALFIAMFR